MTPSRLKRHMGIWWQVRPRASTPRIEVLGAGRNRTDVSCLKGLRLTTKRLPQGGALRSPCHSFRKRDPLPPELSACVGLIDMPLAANPCRCRKAC